MNADEELEKLFQRHREPLYHRAPEGLEARLARRLARRPRPFQGRVGWALGSAAAMMALLLAFQLGQTSARDREPLLQEIIGSHIRSLMVNHLADVTSTDQHTVKPWFVGRIDFAPTVKDFAAEGFPLVGGRLDYVASRPVAVLVFRSNQHVINVFQWPTSDGTVRAPRFVTRRGFQLFTWQRESMEFWAVSDLNAAELQKFAELWSR